MMMENLFLKRLFEELKELNNVPKFQLERAISPLLGIFIKEIINKKFNANVSDPISEFPLKKRGSKQSTNIDWLLFDETSKIIYCVELKTDPYSYSEAQSKIYKAVKKRIEKKDATFLLTGLKIIKGKSSRQDKYDTVISSFPIKKKDLKDFKNFIIVYIAPAPPKIIDKYYYDELLLFRNLRIDINSDFNSEWLQLKHFLANLYPKADKKRKPLPQEQQEGNLAVFKDLGIYSDDPEEDEKINEKLRNFLKSIGYELPEVEIIKDKE